MGFLFAYVKNNDYLCIMKQEIKEKWVAALRSGEYAQGRNKLKNNNDSYCCLGVLCDVYQKETGKGNWNDGTFYDGEEIGTGVPPWSVINWAEMINQNPDTKGGASLAELNDAGSTFDVIADVIEKEL